MADKTIMFMAPFYSFMAEEFIEKLNEVSDDEDFTVMLNSPGGSVFAGWSVIAALEKKKGVKTVEVLGNASSMALYATLFFNNVKAYDVSTFMLHRADGYTETDEEREWLDGINAKLREKLESRIDQTQLRALKDVTLDDIFNGKQRIDVFFTAEEAKKVGLVSSIERLDTKDMAAMNEKFVAFYNPPSRGRDQEAKKPHGSGNTDKKKNVEPKITKMTKEEFKAQHPDLYKEVYTEGVTAERDRAEAFMEFADVDVKTVKENISAGNAPSAKFYAEMTRKGMAMNQKNEAEQESTEEQNTPDADGKEAKEKEYDAWKKGAFKAAGITEKKEG